MPDDDIATIDLRQLRYFLAVFEELHFGHAADRLHMAQPPLSNAIRKLEYSLGVPLFQRTSRSVVPTEAGHALASTGRNILAAVDLAVIETRRAAGIQAVRIGCTPHVPIDQLQSFLGRVRASLDDSAIQVTHLAFAEQMRLLRSGALELAIFHGAGHDDDVETQPLFPGERFVAILPPGSPLADKQALGPDDVAAETLVSFPRTANPAFYDWRLALLEDAGYRFAATREAAGTNDRDVILEVVNGSGVAIVPASLARDNGALGLVSERPLEAPLAMPDTVIGWRSKPLGLFSDILVGVRALALELRETQAERNPE